MQVVNKFHLVVFLALLGALEANTVTWSDIPSVRCGQITSIVSLTTSTDVSPTTTDQTATFVTPLSVNTNLKYGLSLMSYDSWMTDTFSFNISMVSYSNLNLTVRFLVLDNTFFTKAKVHYLVVWRPGTFPNNYLGTSPPLSPNTYNFIDVAFGCYLTDSLLTGTGNRSFVVGGFLSSSNYDFNISHNQMSTTIAGLQLTNNLGVNNFVKVQTFINNTNQIFHNVTVQNNNFLKFICVTTVIYDPGVNQYYQKSIIQHQTMILNATSSGLASVPYSQRYDGESHMFFGFSQFNLSMSDTRYLNIESSNISLVSLYYRKNIAMHEVIADLLFFSFRTCTDINLYYYPLNYTCLSTCPSNSVPYGNSNDEFSFCNPCHYSCNTCSLGQSPNLCLTCPPIGTSFRNTPGGGTCPCDPRYADIGQTNCVLCNEVMPGCVSCTSRTVCTDCDNITYVLNPSTQQCSCMTNYFLVSGFCLSYSGCLEAIQFNNTLACTTCDTSLNYVRNTLLQSCACNEGFFLNISVPDCYDVCGDGITASGFCDDGNLNYGDGCDQLCNVENGYHCTTSYNGSAPGPSKCIMITTMTVSHLYAQRVVNSNKFKMYFSFSPPLNNLPSNSFTTSNFVTNMPAQNIQITYDSANSMVTLEGEYLQTLEGQQYTLIVTYDNNADFYAQPTTLLYTAKGINAQLTIDIDASYNDILPLIVKIEGIITILVAIFASVVGLKLAGLQLLLPVQLLYFSLATIGSQSSYSASLAEYKYSNGYSVITNYDYQRTYDQNKNLVAITYESQFLLSTNVMLVLFVVILIWLLVHHIRIRCKESSLEQYLKAKQISPDQADKKEVNSDQSEREPGEVDQEQAVLKKHKKDESTLEEEQELRQDHHYSLKVFSFEVDRAYFILYILLVNQMLFGFTVMSLNLPLSSFFFNEEMSVILCNFLTFVLMGNMVFVLHDQTSNKMVNFTCINDRYAYLYFLFQVLIIFVLAYTFEQTWSVYVITAMASAFIVLVIVERPYCKDLIELENLVALYLAAMLLVCQVILCVMSSSNLTQTMNLILTVLIIALVFVGQILTIIRIILRVNFKKAFDDLRNPKCDRDNDNKNKKRVKEKNLDLLGKDDADVVPPDSVRNGLFTPKDKMIDWEARNTEQYESMCVREGIKETYQINKEAESGTNNREQEQEENKESKFNELQLLKKRLRNTLKIKREKESETRKTD